MRNSVNTLMIMLTRSSERIFHSMRYTSYISVSRILDEKHKKNCRVSSWMWDAAVTLLRDNVPILASQTTLSHKYRVQATHCNPIQLKLSSIYWNKNRKLSFMKYLRKYVGLLGFQWLDWASRCWERIFK